MDRESPVTPERLALSQELGEFLIEFSIALHRTSMYPWGHPSLDRAATMVLGRLAALLADRPSISIGVAKRQLVIEGVATDPKHPVLRSLAEKLHRHHVGAIVFERGTSTDEVIGMMRLIGVEPEKGATPLGLGDPDLLRQWRYLRLYPLTYEQLELIGGAQDEDDDEADTRERGTRSAQLWIGLARAALASEDKEIAPEATEPTAVAEAINRHPAARAYDQVIVGYLLQLAQELKQDGGLSSLAVRKRLSRLIGALDESTLQRLTDMGGDLTQRKKFVLDATEALAADAVVDIVQAAAASTQQDISNSMVRLLTKLSSLAEEGNQLVQIHADNALREQVQYLLEDWRLEDPNPDAYTRALESLAQRSRTLAATARTRHPPEPLRIVQMALEVDSVGLPFWRAATEVLQADGITPLVAALEAAPADNRAARALRRHLGSSDRLREILSREAIDFPALDHILAQSDAVEIAPVLMDVLTESAVRGTRLGVFKRLAALDLAVIEPLLLQRVDDERWYVCRNMLALLNEKNAFTESIQPAKYVRHDDARVRREALQLWLRSPLERDRAICVALADQDERVMRLALPEAQNRLPDAAVAVVARRVHDALPGDLRTQLVRLLHNQRGSTALEALLRVASTGRTLLGRPKLAPRSSEMLAALGVLAENWTSDRRAAAVLNRARRSSDATIRAAAQAGR